MSSSFRSSTRTIRWQANALVWFKRDMNWFINDMEPLVRATEHITNAIAGLNYMGLGPGFITTVREACRIERGVKSGRLFDVHLELVPTNSTFTVPRNTIAQDILKAFHSSGSDTGAGHFQRVELLIGETKHIWSLS